MRAAVSTATVPALTIAAALLILQGACGKQPTQSTVDSSAPQAAAVSTSPTAQSTEAATPPAGPGPGDPPSEPEKATAAGAPTGEPAAEANPSQKPRPGKPERPGALDGRVVFNGEPPADLKLGENRGVPGVIAVLTKDGEELGRTTTDEKGRFRFPDLPAGAYQVQIEHAQLGKAEQAAEVESGAITVLGLGLHGNGPADPPAQP